MSEYQYYEFLAVDRPLTEREMRELRAISSRAEITPTHFSNEYHFSGLKAEPAELLERYFDLYLYLSEWGSRELALRLPADVVPLEEVAPYCVGHRASARSAGDYTVIHLWGEAEEYEEWVEGRGWMGSLAGARNELLRGDPRLLYLAWLFCAEGGEVDGSVMEPPVPAGLGSLSASLQTVVEFLRIDQHLIAAAAERSPAEAPDPGGLAAWVAALPAKEKDDLLFRIVQGEEASVAAALVRRFRAEARRPTDVQGGRFVTELLERADELRDAYVREQARRAEEARRRREVAEAAARARHLDKLATRKAQAWREVEPLVSSKKPKAYDQAAALLVDLCDLAVREGDENDFSRRVVALRERHGRKPSFIARLDQAGLPKGGG